MLSLFYGLRHLVKTKSVVTEGPVFRMHCQWTVLFLLCSSLLLTCRQYFGDPIHCLQNDVSRIKALETFCWIHATFILPHAWNSTVGKEVPHPGISTYVQGETRVYHAYYQWVALVLLLQGILFYIPKYVWKSLEKDTMKAFSLDLQDPLLPEQQAKKSIKLLVNALKTRWGHFGEYMRGYMICEILNLINIGGQMFLMDRFLDGTFSTFGIRVLQWSEWDQEYRVDPLVEAFPRMTKCVFYEFGSSGDVQRRDALCILPLNHLNEKIIIFLWFWFVFLCVATLLIVLYRLVLACLPMLRYCVLVPRASTSNKGALDKLLMEASMGDWFVMYLLAKNIDPVHYRAVVGHLASALMQNGHLSASLMSIGDRRKREDV